MKYQRKIVDGKEVIYSADWILDLESESHFRYYWKQLSLVYETCSREEEILELGVGTSLLSDVLRRRRFRISTLDIDPDKHPDYCANALDFDYSSKPFSTLLAFEIFEHIPFATFSKVVDVIGDSSINKIIFSVPWCEHLIQPFTLKLPRVPAWSPSIKLRHNHIGTPAHFWELGRIKTVQACNDEKLLIPFHELENLFSRSDWTIKRIDRRNNIQFLIASRSDFNK
jgi:hypothetical protein